MNRCFYKWLVLAVALLNTGCLVNNASYANSACPLKHASLHFVLKEIHFAETPVEEVFSYIEKESKKQTDGSPSIRFHLHLTGYTGTFTWSATNVPASELLEKLSYVCGLKLKFDGNDIHVFVDIE